MTDEISVGKEVLSHCNKCKLALAHLIVSMKNNTTIGKVECKTCNATHAYKDPSKSKSKAKRKKTAGSKSKTMDRPIADVWMDAINNATSKSQDYGMKKQFGIGDIVDHPTFGPGVVERTIDNDKIQIIFRHDIKVLVHNKN